MLIVLMIVVAVVWPIGFCLTLKLEAAMCDRATDYSMLLSPVCWIIWPLVAVLTLRCKHAARFISYGTEPKIQVHREDWVY